jgi:hypothetical protein
MVYRYIPILRFKAGERAALEKLSAAGRKDVVPLLVLAPDQYVGKKATKAAPAIPSPAYVAQQMSYAWGPQPFYLDATALPATAGGHPLGMIAAHARAAQLALIPATTLGASPQYQTAVAQAASTDGRGVALRIDLSELAQSASWVPGWSFPLNQTDLIIDLGEVSAVVALGAALDPSFFGLAGAGNWRSVTVAGSNMPANFQGVAAGLYPLPRAELALWQRLTTVSLPYRLDFGDYGTVSLAPAPSGIAWGFPITVKYTLGSSYLICRGVRTTGAGGVDMHVQLLGHAQGITAHAGRGALAHCWADGVIDAISAASVTPGGLQQWVGYSVNRHIENTRAAIP